MVPDLETSLAETKRTRIADPFSISAYKEAKGEPIVQGQRE
jgi:hypothetical protein